MRKWLQTCLIQRVKVSHHRDWGDNKHALPSCMTTPSVWQSAGAQPAVIRFLTKLLIVWMLLSCRDTLLSCFLICLFHKCFWHARKRSTALGACAKSILKVCRRRGESSSARKHFVPTWRTTWHTTHTNTRSAESYSAPLMGKKEKPFLSEFERWKDNKRAVWAACYYCVTHSSSPEMIHAFDFLKPSFSLDFLHHTKSW